jgi:hypothetical protein
MKQLFIKFAILILLISVRIPASEARSYLVRYNDHMSQISTLSAKLLVSSRMPGLTLADQRGMLRYESPNKVDISGGLKEIIPPEAVLINLHHILMDSAVVVHPEYETIAGGVELNIYAEEPVAGRLEWTVKMDTLRWYIREIHVIDAKENSVNVHFRQQSVQEDLYLPHSIEVLMISSDENKRVPNPRRHQIIRPNDESTGKMTIRLSNYKMNDPSVYEFFLKGEE